MQTLEEGFQLWHRYCCQSHANPEDHYSELHEYVPPERPIATMRTNRTQQGTLSAPCFSPQWQSSMCTDSSSSSRSLSISPHATLTTPLSPHPMQPATTNCDSFYSASLGLTFSESASSSASIVSASSSNTKEKAFYALRTTSDRLILSSE